MKDKCDFTLGHYENILKSAKRKGFEFAFFTERNPFPKTIYLRHDIDVFLENSFQIAEIEKINKVHSTFFVRTHSNFYNPLSLNSIKIIRKIFELGHAIGLHYDGEINLEKLEGFINREYHFLKNFIPISKMVSFHHPDSKVFGLELKEFTNTYNPYFFKQCEYISDSNRELKKGCIREFILKTSSKRIQILTHPIWWNEKSLNLTQIYHYFLKEKEKESTEEFKENTKCYKKFFEKR